MTVVEVVTRVRAAPEVVSDLELDAGGARRLDGRQRRAGGHQHGAGGAAARRRVTFSARHLGLCWRLTGRVTAYDRPRRSVDEPVRGPSRSMRHEHLVEPVAGGTRTTDRMAVRAPLGPLGAAVTQVVLGPYPRRLLAQRAAHVRALAGAA